MQACEPFSGFQEGCDQNPTVIGAGNRSGVEVGVREHLLKSLQITENIQVLGLARSFSPGCDHAPSHPDQKGPLTVHYLCL